MKYYVDIVYIMIVNGVLISKDKNKFVIGEGLKVIKRGDGVSNVKKANGLKSVKDQGLKNFKIIYIIYNDYRT